MAMNLRGLCRLNISLANNVLFKPNFTNAGFIRYLYTVRDLGITGYETTRLVFRNEFMMIEDTFRAKMKEICEQEDGVIYTDDLKAMLHLVQHDESDIELLNKLLIKYVKCNETRKYSTYIFSPIAMRMYYYLNQPRHALAMFENPIFSDSLKYRSSFRILVCLLLKSEMYEEIRRLFLNVLENRSFDYIGSTCVILFAACLKENTPEAFECAFDQWKRLYEYITPGSRCYSIMSLIALRADKPEIALEILSGTNRPFTTGPRNIKILIFLKTQRYIQMIPIFKHALDRSDASRFKYTFFAEVMSEVEQELNTKDVTENSDLITLVNNIKKHDLIDSSITLEEYLLRPLMSNSIKNNINNRSRSSRTRPNNAENKVGLLL